MDDLDRRLLDAWTRHKRKLVEDSGQDHPIRGRKRQRGRTYQRPVRSRCLVLRANDRRIDDLPEGVVEPAGYVEEEPGIECGVMGVRVDREVVSRLCGPVAIPWPGVDVSEAARRFGVNPTTVRRWAKRGLIVMDRDENRADAKRSACRVWTRRAVDPSGHVWAEPWWGHGVGNLAESLPEGFSQTLLRTHRCLGDRSMVLEWLCDGCGRRSAKVYYPVPVMTIGKWLGAPPHQGRRRR